MTTQVRPRPQRQRRQRGTGGVRLRADGRFEATLPLPADGSGRRARLSGYGLSASEALADLERKRVKHASGLDQAGGKTSIADWLSAWFDSKTKAKYSTRRAYEQSIRLHLIPRLGAATLSTLTPPMIGKAIKGIEAESGAASARNAHAVLRAALAEADRMEIVPRNAAKKVIPPSVRRNVPTPWGLGEARAFLRAVEQDRLHAMWVIAGTSGPRPSELLALGWHQVDENARTIAITETLVTPTKRHGDPYLDKPKTAAGLRVFSLSPATVAILAAHRQAQAIERDAAAKAWHDNGLVFTSPLGRPLRVDGLNHRFHDIVAAAGLPQIRLYDLRRLSAALILAATGGDLQEAKSQLGQSSIELASETYGYRMQETSRATADAVEALLSNDAAADLRYPVHARSEGK